MIPEDLYYRTIGIEKRLDGMVQPEKSLSAGIQRFLVLPGLRGFWPMAAVDSSGNAQDLSGHAHHLTYNGNPVYGLDITTAWSIMPYLRFDGTGDYLSRTDEADFDITGTETYFASQASTAGAARGITLGGWFYPEDTTNAQSLINKFYTAGQYAYDLALRGDVASDPVYFSISDDGTNFDSATSSVAYSANTWQFLVGRFNDADSGNELVVWVNTTKSVGVTARASINSGSDNLGIGGKASGANLFTGRASLVFICAAALPDEVIRALYRQTRGLFGV